MRTLIDLPEDHVKALDDIGERRGVSRAKIVREAVRDFLRRNAVAASDDAFGMWRDRKIDGLEHQRRIREEW